MGHITKSSELQFLVDKVKRESFFSNLHQNLLISPSPYDTAWLALIPDPLDPTQPLFEKCLEWILHNQTAQGFWAAADHDYNHDNSIAQTTVTLECLVATLACLVALKRWQLAPHIIDRGLEFVRRNAERLVMKKGKLRDVPRWFTIMFPAMLELVKDSGLRVAFNANLNIALVELSQNRTDILAREKVDDKHQYYSPLLLFLEALPVLSYDIAVLRQIIDKNLSNDGSLFQSPSATVRAYMITGNTRCLSYLQSLTKTCPNGGVPSFYHADEDLHQLVMVNQLMRSGLTEHFIPEIEQLLLKVQKNYDKYKKASSPKSMYGVAAELYKDSLAFWLLRINGLTVSPSIFCWFLHEEEICDHIETNYQEFAAVLLQVYRATDLMFSGEVELEEARCFASKYLQKILAQGNTNDHISSSLHTMIEHELRLPWTARMDHLEHRIWIEEKASTALWLGKSSYLRLSCFHKMNLQQLAVKNYTLRQSIYRDELEQVKRWSKERGLCDMGFGREKTEYCYFAFAASTCLPCSSDVRQILTKAAVVITVADDFFDLEGSMDDLENLTDAVRRWDVKGLGSHSKTIFKALDDLITEVRVKCFRQNGEDIKNNLQQLWYETFHSWLMEARWGKGKLSKPSVEMYLRNAMTSIAAHTMVLSASCLLGPGFPVHQLWPDKRHHLKDMTSLLMVSTRLLNDIQSYLKEEEEGKINYVWMYMNENKGASIDESVEHVRAIINERRQEFIQHVLSTDEHSDLPKSCKQLHLSCLKVFNMFFNSSNLYDSETELLYEIDKAFIFPPQVQKSKPHIEPPHQLPPTLHPPHQPREMVKNNKKKVPVVMEMVYKSYPHPWKVFAQQKQSSAHGTMNRRANILAGPNMKLCFN